ncbi:glycosyltransferase family 4 protein [Parageobacillus thermoglucosidasius]|uniref:glycosyltransferase family 4 protein n=1 Tax=Parageobacillus thermoglucosidasius TaxID=1426 RepID=UPI0027F12913|nr:glycosyltransferase family 4 protein [Parageobacillus thermoglucosidasius]
MRKALLVSTVSRQFTLFDRDNIRILKELGYEVHCAANFEDATPDLNSLGIVRHHFDIQRSPYSVKNIKAFFQLLRIMKTERFDLVHCHAPMGGVLGRLCAQLTGTRPVLYTAHGFHFYKGAPIINNLIYKNIERIAAHWTDCLLAMNREDYIAAQHFRLRDGGKVYYIPGVGVDTNAINNVQVDRRSKRRELGIPEDAFLIISIGELIKRKNHQQAIEAIAKLKQNGYDKIYHVICGRGILMDELKALSENLGVSDRVCFLGYRNDIPEILKVSDLFVFTSFQEGLPKSVMEAMAAGLPIVATRIRGNIDLIEDGKNGLLVECGDVDSTIKSILELYNNEELRILMSKNNLNKIKNYDSEVVREKMDYIYKTVMGSSRK